ncbi:MAG TPA: hypothetical protein VF909_09145 [Roseiflexaceae bacterium]
MDIGQLAIVVVCAVLGIWYVGASVYNRRRGMELTRWLQAGLRSLGGKAEYKWIGSSGSGLRASATGLAKPFKRLDAVLLLETRELLPLWLFQRASGRRDQLILKCALQRAVKVQLDAAPRVVPPDGWSYIQATPALQLTASGAATEQLATALQSFFERYDSALRSFSYRSEEPQVVLALNLARVEARPAEELFRALARCLDMTTDKRRT